MPVNVACPNCERKLKVPDALLGKRVKCPSCQTTFTAAAEAEPERPSRPTPKPKPASPPRKPADDDDDGPQQYAVFMDPDQEEKESPKKSKQGLLEKHLGEQIDDERSKRGKRPFTEEWKKSRIGIRIVALAAFILFANFIVQGAGRGIIWFVTRPEEPETTTPNPQQKANYEARVKEAEIERKEKRRYLVSAVAIVYLVHQVIALVGIGLCLLSPEKDNLRLLVVPALVLALGSLGLEIALSVAPLQYLISGTFNQATGEVPLPHPALKIAGDLVGYLRCFAFLFFMRQIGKTTKTDELRREVLMLMFFMGVAILFWAVMASITAARLSADLNIAVGAIVIEGSVLGVLGAGSLALVLASVAWFTMTLYTTTVAITDWIRERPTAQIER